MPLNRFAKTRLDAWFKHQRRKPLILRGARQTGKSTSIRQLGQSAKFFIEINLENHLDLELVKTCHSATDLCERLQQKYGLSNLPPDTLLFLDEIQEHPPALTWLRFFHENHPEIAVVAAGSLMEVRLRDSHLPFPVGRVEFMRLEPLSFFEFLEATNGGRIASDLRGEFSNPNGIPTGLHQLATERLRHFLLVGGMPEAVSVWAETENLNEVSKVHHDLVQAYFEDLLKYGLRTGTSALQSVLLAAPNLYGSRFKNRNLVSGLKDRALAEAIELLELAMVIHRAVPTYSQQLPLIPRAKAAHKLIPLDVGLALSQLGVRAEQLLDLPVESLLDGRIAEMFVGLQLLGTSTNGPRNLYFWTREYKGGRAAEVDYLVSTAEGILPVEVKAGKTGSLKSLHQYLAASGGSFGYRLASGAGGVEDLKVKITQGRTILYRLKSLPLYMAELIPVSPTG